MKTKHPVRAVLSVAVLLLLIWGLVQVLAVAGISPSALLFDPVYTIGNNPKEKTLKKEKPIQTTLSSYRTAVAKTESVADQTSKTKLESKSTKQLAPQGSSEAAVDNRKHNTAHKADTAPTEYKTPPEESRTNPVPSVQPVQHRQNTADLLMNGQRLLKEGLEAPALDAYWPLEAIQRLLKTGQAVLLIKYPGCQYQVLPGTNGEFNRPQILPLSSERLGTLSERCKVLDHESQAAPLLDIVRRRLPRTGQNGSPSFVLHMTKRYDSYLLNKQYGAVAALGRRDKMGATRTRGTMVLVEGRVVYLIRSVILDGRSHPFRDPELKEGAT